MHKPPNKHLIAVINFFLLVPLVYFIPDFVGPFLPDNKLVNVATAVAIIVPIISYIAMPITLRFLSAKK